MVFARYNPLASVGRIDVVMLQKTANGKSRMVMKHFTPEDGLRWVSQSDRIYGASLKRGKGSMTYYTETSTRNGYGMNPFDNDYISFKGSGDGRFHNISQSGFLSAVGMAQKSYRAGQSYTAIAQPRQDVETEQVRRARRHPSYRVLEGRHNPECFLWLERQCRLHGKGYRRDHHSRCQGRWVLAA